MRKFFLIASAAASMFAVGCVSPEDACETQANAVCDKVFQCSSDSVKAYFGANAADCKAKLIKAADCSNMKSFDAMCTDEDAGKKFDLGKANECLDAFKAQSCTDFNNGTSASPACQQTCK